MNASDVPALVLVRHGETEWSRSGQHTGRTDVELTPTGEAQAKAAGDLVRRVLEGATPARIISSPRQRAIRTAELAGFPPDEVTEAAAEWDYGQLEGLTTPEIRERFSDWSIWSGPVPGGESATEVSARCDALLDHARGFMDRGPVLIFSHGHASRCLAARWLSEPVTAGQYFGLGTGAVCALGYEHNRPVMLRWNLDRSLLDG